MSNRYNDRDDDRYSQGEDDRYSRDYDSAGGRYGREGSSGRSYVESARQRSGDYSTGRDYGDYGYGRDTDYGRNYGSRGYGREGEYGDRAGSENYGPSTGRNYGYDRESSSRHLSRGNRYAPDYTRGSGRSYDRSYDRGYDYDRDTRREERYIGPDRTRRGQDDAGPEGDYRPREGDERGWWERASDEVASWFGDEEAERRRRMDQRGGQYRGRGPKGYKRSDERILEDINDRLTDDAYLDASDIEVRVDNGEVTLSGTVFTRYDKRRAEDIIEDVSGVKHVQNNLRPRKSTDTDTTTAITTGTTDTTTDTGTTSSQSAAAGGPTTT